MSKNQPIIKVIDKTAYQIIPTEKGYAYVIFLSTIITIGLTWFHMNSIGVLYNDFFKDSGDGTSGFTLAIGIGQGVSSVSGIIATSLLKTFTHRQVQILAAVIYSLGWLLNFFMKNLFHFIIAYSILTCLGQGMLTIGALVSFNDYFVKKKTFMYSLVQIFIAIGPAVFPLFIEYSFGEYGFRGTVLITTGIIMHTIFGALLMHPLEWHSTIKRHYDVIPQSDNTVIELKMKEIKHEFNVNDFDDDSSPDNPSIFYKIYRYLELDMFYDWVFVNIIIGLSLQVPTDILFFSMYPEYLYSIGFQLADVTLFLSVATAFDVLGKGVIALLNKFTKITSREIMYLGIIVTFISRIIFLQCLEWTSLLIITSVIAFFKAMSMATMPMVLAEYNAQRFGASSGLSMLSIGIFSLILSPIIGFARDKLDSYAVAFYMTAGLLIPCIVSWTIEMFWIKRKR